MRRIAIACTATRRACALAVLLAGTAPAPAGAAPAAEAGPAPAGAGADVAAATHAGGGLRLVGRSDLGGGGRNADVAVVGTTAVVGAGLISAQAAHVNWYNPIQCRDVTVKIVSLADPARPTVASTIPVPSGVVALDVAALKVATPSFTGDLAAVALATCGTPGANAEKGVAYYDVSNPASPQFLGRYQADADNVPPAAPECSATSSTRCASSQHSVELFQRPDGRVLSLSTQPGASAAALPSGDLRIVDVTNPRTPVQLGAFPSLGERPTGGGGFFRPNGCRTFYSGHEAEPSPDGSKALLSYLDEGVWSVDISNPAAPKSLGRFEYPLDRNLEGSAGHAAWADVAGRQLGLVAEEDWVAPTSTLRVDAPASLAGSKFACEAMFTLFDPENTAQVYRKPNQQVPGELVYVGRGCPAIGTVTVADPYLGNPAGKIALIDRNPTRQTGIGGICQFHDRVLRAQQAGAVGVVFADTNATPSFSPDGNPAGLDIPAFIVEKGDGDALRDALCPTYSGGAGGTCTGGQAVTGAMVDRAGEWGGLRSLDLANPAAPSSLGVFRTPRSLQFPPPDSGVYSVHHAIARGTRAYAAWNSDGLRVLDLTTPTPTEIASFVPPDSPDPTSTIPGKAHVIGVDTMPGYVVITDIHSGLYVLELGAGYWTAAADGGVFAFGSSDFFGSMGGTRLNRPIVGMAPTPSGKGYWLVAADGGVFAFGDARFLGSTGAITLNRPIVAMSATPSGRGYWLVASDGGVFAFGDARFLGSTGAIALNSPVVGMTPTPSGLGYWLVAADGGIFAFGDARFLGSTGNLSLNRPVVGMAAAPGGAGYWLVASDGGVFAFGTAAFLGSTGAIRLNSPVVAMAATPTRRGYWLTAADGGIFAFGDAAFVGSTGAIRLNSPVVGVGAFPG
ncbi:MAG: PA domain-containing protein [Actinomycetota bacterium]